MAATRRVLLLLSIAWSIAATAAAQTAVTIDDLTAPTAPGFVILDVAPAAVDRPDTPKAFTLNLLNKLASSRGVPQNYGVQVAPYWMASHPTLTFHEYQHPNPWQSLAQTFSVSMATVPLPGPTAKADPIGTRLGLGVRTNIVNGRPNPTLEDLVQTLHDVDDQILNTLNAGGTVSPQLRTRARDAAAAVQAADAERIGFFLAVAAGQAWSFPDDDVEHSVVDRRSFWITPSYRLRTCSGAACESMLDVIGVARGLKDKGQDWAWDYGGRAVWRPIRAFDASIESLARRQTRSAGGLSTTDTSNRTVAIVEYRIRQDLVAYASFGRDFVTGAGVRPLVSMLGLNIGFGPKPLVNADQKTP